MAPPSQRTSKLADGVRLQAEEEKEKDQEDLQDSGDEFFLDAELEHFVIYRPHRSFQMDKRKSLKEAPLANEMVSLHEINERQVHGFLFDGVICFGGEKRYVQKIPFETLSIGGYGDLDRSTSASDIWIQSFEGRRLSVWYRLKTPAAEYLKYHEPFLWIAELGKRVVDYLCSHRDVTLSHFREKFPEWLECVYGQDGFHRQWMKPYGRQDFRQVVVSQANFLWYQAIQVDERLEQQPLWGEIHPRYLSAIPERTEKGARAEMFAQSFEARQIISRRKTTVTPYVYKCFKHLPWAKFLYCQKPSVVHTNPSEQHFPIYRHHHAPQITPDFDHPGSCSKTAIRVGDVVALPLDKRTTWKSVDKEWFGYVQSITDAPKGRKLGLLWLYRPSDTQCLKVPYPNTKELFLSDHCNCGDVSIYSDEVIRKPLVAFFGRPNTKGMDFFVRQKYIEGDGAWQTLQESDFNCKCEERAHPPKFLKGDTLLVSINKVLEPVIFDEHEPDGLSGMIRVRRLARRGRDYGDVETEPNELVLTDYFKIIPLTAVSRDCEIRLYTRQEKEERKIPTPYDRHGTGDCYTISALDLQGIKADLQSPMIPPDIPMREGWNPQIPVRKPLKGLDIFCGGGNFGRGLEEGGAVHFQWAVDWDKAAIHSYKANLKEEDQTYLFHGSVNDYLSQAMQGKGGPAVAQRGEVELIAAGSPCQGFSHANPNKGNDRSLFNISMIASVVAFIEFYRPKYALMENVKGMASGPDTENILALVISALVGLGYQVRTFALDAWSFGSPQSRTRVFVSIAAPGLSPLPEPPHSHSHPENVIAASLGTLANGLKSSSRYTMQTPFKYISSEESTKDLPATDARTSCIHFPDHRMSKPLSTLARVLIGSIPRFPGGGTFITAFKRGRMPQPQIDAFDWSSVIRSHAGARGWQRVRRDALMPTVMTEPRPDDGVNGTCVHWDEERLLTIMEVRRGQGFPDEEILLGLLRDQWKIVGNSVARPVALALGISLRKAELSNGTMQKFPSRAFALSSEVAGSPQMNKLKLAVVVGVAASQQPHARPSLLDENDAAMIPPTTISPAMSNLENGARLQDNIKKPRQDEMNGSSAMVLQVNSKESNKFVKDGFAHQEEIQAPFSKSTPLHAAHDVEHYDLSFSKTQNIDISPTEYFLNQRTKISDTISAIDATIFS